VRKIALLACFLASLLVAAQTQKPKFTQQQPKPTQLDVVPAIVNHEGTRLTVDANGRPGCTHHGILELDPISCTNPAQYTCADKTRVLLQAEDDTRYCVKF
jgi:hypothetical protein